MYVLTVVEGEVPAFKSTEFEAKYALVKREPLPPGFVSSSLLRNSKNPEVYRIQTVWESREALEKMRSSTQTPKAFQFFQEIGTQPTLEVFNIIETVT